ncbi:MAG TPA: ATP-binding protein, partial [Gallionellaceae bacterium]|nr:ATP-binding protein [Gallionellaceae bacterium]
MKTWLVDHVAKCDRVELEQSFIRLGIGLIILVFLLGRRFLYTTLSSNDIDAFAITSLYVFSAIALTSIILLGRNRSVVRRLAGAWVDTGVITLFMMFTGEIGIILVGGYLWVIFGNGFRFGKKYLFHAQLLSIAGFVIATQVSPYWEVHETIIYSVLLMLLALPVYVSALIGRIETAKQRADEANAAKTRFVANMSHEIRTPLNGIVGITTLFRTTPLNHEQQELIDTLDSSSRLLMSLLNNVLDFAKIEEGKLAIELTNFSADVLLQDTARIFRPLAESKGVHLDTNITSEIGPLRGDPHRLQQVLANLLGNAVKFTERGSIILSLSLLQRNEHDCHVRFEVVDTGLGIPASAQGRIFESFTQADISTTRRFGGSGLGLTIARHLVEAMGGHLLFESSENLGSRFWFDLTLGKAARIQPNKATVVPLEEAKDVDFGYALNILVCEDDATNQKILMRLLELAGHHVTLSANGEEMLDQLEHGSFDLVIADLNMAGMSGTDALKLYRFIRPDDTGTRFILFTADATMNARQAAKEAGFDAFLSKPVDAPTLFGTVAKLLDLPATISENWLNTAMSMPGSSPVPNTQKAGVVLDDTTLRDLENLGASDTLFVDRLLRNYMLDSEALLVRIEQAIENRHYGSVREYCHALKGNSLSIGAFAV